MKIIPMVAFQQASAQLKSVTADLDNEPPCYSPDLKDISARNKKYLNAIQSLEKLCVSMRREALCCASDSERSRVEEALNEPLDITAEVTETGFLHARFPIVLPSRKKTDNIQLIAEVLRSKLSQLPNIPYSAYPQTFIVCHNYKADLPEQLIRDHDNYEVKRIIDTVTPFCMPDDSVKYCDRFFTSKVSDYVSTEIWVIPTAKLGEWLRSIQK